MLFETLESIPGFGDGKLTNRFGNWANDTDCAPFVGCSFMDLHDDVGYGASPEQPMFTIQPVYWDTSAFLVVSDDDHYEIRERTDHIVQFDATKLHGLFPWMVAQELVERQDDQGPVYQEFECWCLNHVSLPKLLWQWIQPTNKES